MQHPEPPAQTERGDGDVLASFAARLDELASSLPPLDRRALDVLLLCALPPLDRLRAQGSDGLLTPEEQQALDDLDEDGSRG